MAAARSPAGPELVLGEILVSKRSRRSKNKKMRCITRVPCRGQRSVLTHDSLTTAPPTTLWVIIFQHMIRCEWPGFVLAIDCREPFGFLVCLDGVN